MAPAIGGRARQVRYRGLGQFRRRGDTLGIGYCIAGPRPYALEFNNDSDVICLLLGDIATETRFEDEAPRPLLFAGQSSAFHPRGGNVRVRADAVQSGFIAFSYSPAFQGTLDDVDIGRARRAGSRNNVRQDTIAALARFARRRLGSPGRLDAFELQSLASHVYLETLRVLGRDRPQRRSRLADREFAAVCDCIEAELGSEMSCARLAEVAEVPLRVVFDGMKERTGLSPYRYVLERRIARARELLTGTDLAIAEIALICGFSSQQHLTSTLSGKLGATPLRIRLGA
jgi:AraC family transcriptional regulator